MRTKDEMKEHASEIAAAIVYSDDERETPWEPFAYWDEDNLAEVHEEIAEAIFDAMLWVQEGTLT
jgi:hypothetical protein